MKTISAWPWKGIWQALGVLALLVFMTYSPYLLVSRKLDRIEDTMNRGFDAMDRRFDAIDTRFDAIDDKLANIDKHLAVVEDRVGVTAQHIPVRPDSALASPCAPLER